MPMWMLRFANVSPHKTMALWKKSHTTSEQKQQRNKSSSNAGWDLELIEQIDECIFFLHLCTQSALYSYRYCTVSMQRREGKKTTSIKHTNTIELYACFTSLKNAARNKMKKKNIKMFHANACWSEIAFIGSFFTNPLLALALLFSPMHFLKFIFD